MREAFNPLVHIGTCPDCGHFLEAGGNPNHDEKGRFSSGETSPLPSHAQSVVDRVTHPIGKEYARKYAEWKLGRRSEEPSEPHPTKLPIQHSQVIRMNLGHLKLEPK